MSVNSRRARHSRFGRAAEGLESTVPVKQNAAAYVQRRMKHGESRAVAVARLRRDCCLAAAPSPVDRISREGRKVLKRVAVVRLHACWRDVPSRSFVRRAGPHALLKKRHLESRSLEPCKGSCDSRT